MEYLNIDIFHVAHLLLQTSVAVDDAKEVLEAVELEALEVKVRILGYTVHVFLQSRTM